MEMGARSSFRILSPTPSPLKKEQVILFSSSLAKFLNLRVELKPNESFQMALILV